MRKLSRLAVAAAVVAAVLSPASNAAAHGDGDGDGEHVHIPNSVLASIRAAVAPLHTTASAEADGRSLLPICFDDPALPAGMGVHYVKGVDTTLDPLVPEALVYGPSPSGGWKLVAVEYIVPKADWDATHTARPQLFGASFHDGPFDLYVLHVWLFKQNPDGVTADYNPRVGLCPGH